MYPSQWHPSDVQAAETMRRYLAEAEQARLARQTPRRHATLRARLAIFLHALAEALDRPPVAEHCRDDATTPARRLAPTPVPDKINV